MAVALTSFTLSPLPAAPGGRVPHVRGALRYLTATHASVAGILDAFALVRVKATSAKKTAVGRLSRDQVDLLRAALVFTSSGLDAACHRLVRDAAPALVARGGGAKAQYEAYLKEQLDLPKAPSGLLEALTGPDPGAALLARYVHARTSASFQGSSDLRRRVRELLGIPGSVIPNSRLNALDPFFLARNQIVHQLDYVEPAGQTTGRNHRAPGDVVADCDRVLLLISDFASATAKSLK